MWPGKTDKFGVINPFRTWIARAVNTEMRALLSNHPTKRQEFARRQLTGVDVSHYQSAINWKGVKEAGVDFVSIKATQGMSDYPHCSYFTENIQPARAAGLIAGGYHFLNGDMDGKAQADYFLKVSKPKPGDLLPMLDVEQTNGASNTRVAKNAQIWLEKVSEAVGKKPFIYTTKAFWQAIGNPGAFEDYPLWVADYGVADPKIPIGWSSPAIWQKSRNGRVNGIVANVDIDLFYGSMAELQYYRI